MRYRAQLLDRYGHVIEQIASDDPAEIERYIRTVGAALIAHDDERFNGDGDFEPGELRWFENPDPLGE